MDMTHCLKAMCPLISINTRDQWMCHTDVLLWSAREIASMALPAERERHTENLWQCETLWSALSTTLSTERERHTENVFHIVLNCDIAIMT